MRDGVATEAAAELSVDAARQTPAPAPSEARTDIARALLQPNSIALIGLGNVPDSAVGRALPMLRRHSFPGAVYPINAALRSAQSVRTWRDLSSVPGPVDLALILLEGEAAIYAIEACGRANVPVAVLQSPLANDEDEARLRAAARANGVRVLGPGSSGVVAPGHGLALTPDIAFAARPLRPGRFMLLAHGASAMGMLFSRAAAREIGFASMVSFGTEADLSLGEVGAAAADDPDVDAILLYVEGLRHTAAMARFAARAHAAGKPVVAYKVRRDSTGPHAQADAAADAFFRAQGIVRVDHFDALLELAPMLVRRRPRRGRVVAVVSTADCVGTMVADRLARAGIALSGLDDLARERLAQRDAAVPGGRVADVSGSSMRPDAVRAVLDEALDAPNNDAVLAVLGAGAELDPVAAVSPVIDAAARSDKPLAALVVPEAPEAVRLLALAGISAFRTPEAAADGLRAFLEWSPPAPPSLMWEDDDAPHRPARSLHAGQAMQIFRAMGITTPTMLWVRRDAEMPHGLPFPPPYAVKVLSPDLEHRLALGGVALGLETVTAVRAAAAAVVERAIAARPEAYIDGIAIQRMEQGLIEVVIEFHRDPEAGPVVSLALGEGMSDVYRDRAVRLAPVERAAAYEMIDEVKGLAPIRGHRGRPRGDLEALAHALVAMSSFALITSPRVLHATLDPLLVKAEGRGVVALDGILRTE